MRAGLFFNSQGVDSRLNQAVPSAVRPTVLHYTGSTWDGSGIHAVLRQQAGTTAYRCLLGVSPDFVAGKLPRLRCWRGPPVRDDLIGFSNLWKTLRVALRVRRWLRRGPQRVFHGHSRAGLLVGLWLHLLGEKRVVVSVHVYGRQRWFYRWVSAGLGSRLWWQTPAMKRYYGCRDQTWNGCMPNGLAIPQASAMRNGPTGGVLKLGGAGMLVRLKRWDLIIEALGRLPAGCAVEFWHIGGEVDTPASRAYARELRRAVERHRLGARVHWLGWQASSAGLLAQVDAVVVPSDSEAFSMIALEALFAGVPVIATRGGGPEDLLINGENGWLVPPDDAEALARRIELCCDAGTWAGLRVAPDHLQRFSVESLAPQWAAIYASL